MFGPQLLEKNQQNLQFPKYYIVNTPPGHIEEEEISNKFLALKNVSCATAENVTQLIQKTLKGYVSQRQTSTILVFGQMEQGLTWAVEVGLV
jgi:hypothetical protein